MNHKAVYALYPQVVAVDDTAGAFDAQGNKVIIDETLLSEWVDPDLYKQQRFENYPHVGDQLDMLWHAIDTGTLDKTSDFYTALKSVKDSYPKSK